MSTRTLNVCIVDDNRKRVVSLRRHIKVSFHSRLHIALHFSASSVLSELNRIPDVVIMNFYLNDPAKTGENGVSLLKELRMRYPESQVLIMTSNEAVSMALEIAITSMRLPAEREKAKTFIEKIILFHNRYITQPLRVLSAEFS